MKLISLFVPFLIVACSSKMKNTSYFEESDYKNREALSESFLARTSMNLSDEQISKLLNSKIAIRPTVKLALLRIDSTGYKTSLFDSSSYSDQNELHDKDASLFDSIINGQSRVKSVAMIPSFLMPRDLSLANMRDSAALVQADFVLIIRTTSRSNYDLNLFEKDKITVVANLEYAIMDVATGAVPVSGIVTGRSEAVSKKKDINTNEFYIRARKVAEVDALKDIIEASKTYFK